MANTQSRTGVPAASVEQAGDGKTPAVLAPKERDVWRSASPEGPEESTDVVGRLAAHRTVGSAPRDELEWLAVRGRLLHFEAGETVSTRSQPVAGMYIVLRGRLSIHLIRGDTRHKVAEWGAGDVTGLLPFSRLMAPPGETIVDESVDALLVAREDLAAMVRDCPELTSTLVHVMLDRARFFTSTFLHDEKLKSLGKLAAGLAHELNNPAAALIRFANTLPEALEQVEAGARSVGSAGLTPDEVEAIDELRTRCLGATPVSVRSPLEEAEREAAIADWLEAHGVAADVADAVAQSPATLDLLERLADAVRPETLGVVLRWVASDCSVRRLASEIEQAATRISGLVTAVRGFTRLDEAAVPEPVSVGEGLAQTIAVLAGKARAKTVRVAVEVEDSLPMVRAVGAELNQVWANLIDNALDAAPPSGSVEVSARRESEAVVVRVVDNGPGIPADVRERIFDPFFTTKDVGKGTGLGLDIVRRLVDRHDGDIEVHSQPGRTEFVVSLPAVGVADRGGAA